MCVCVSWISDNCCYNLKAGFKFMFVLSIHFSLQLMTWSRANILFESNSHFFPATQPAGKLRVADVECAKILGVCVGKLNRVETFQIHDLWLSISWDGAKNGEEGIVLPYFNSELFNPKASQNERLKNIPWHVFLFKAETCNVELGVGPRGLPQEFWGHVTWSFLRRTEFLLITSWGVRSHLLYF